MKKVNHDLYLTKDSVIDKYRRYLLLEKGLSKNTIEAYMTDLTKLNVYVDAHELMYNELIYNHLEEFIAGLYDQNIKARSIARIISSIKSFFRFLELDEYIENDPSELLEAPKIGLKLPVVLSIDEIDAILGVIDLSTMEGTRNAAIIETLYSCGLRVSELTGLKFSNLYFDENFIRVEGKGNKQRLVPISDIAIGKINDYIIYRKKQKIKRGNEDIVFVSSRGTAISRITVFHFIKEYVDKTGVKKDVSPHTFRHSFATHLLERGANIRAIQEMMGHEKITTTEIYTHIDRSFLRQEIIEHHPRNKK